MLVPSKESQRVGPGEFVLSHLLIAVASPLTLPVCLCWVCMCSAYFLANMLLEVVLATINGVLFGTMSYLMLVSASAVCPAGSA